MGYHQKQLEQQRDTMIVISQIERYFKNKKLWDTKQTSKKRNK